MEATIQKWGNSLGIRLPKLYANEIGMTSGTKVKMKIKDGKVIIEAIKNPKLKLDELLDNINSENIHSELLSDVRGKEVW